MRHFTPHALVVMCALVLQSNCNFHLMPPAHSFSELWFPLSSGEVPHIILKNKSIDKQAWGPTFTAERNRGKMSPERCKNNNDHIYSDWFCECILIVSAGSLRVIQKDLITSCGKDTTSPPQRQRWNQHSEFRKVETAQWLCWSTLTVMCA